MRITLSVSLIICIQILAGCNSKKTSDRETLICGNGSKEWRIVKTLKNGSEVAMRDEDFIVFNCDGTFGTGRHGTDYWELSDDERVLKVKFTSTITPMEFSSTIKELNDTLFVISSIADSDTTIQYLLTK